MTVQIKKFEKGQKVKRAGSKEEDRQDTHL